MRADQYDLDAAHADDHWWWVARRRILALLIDRLVGRGAPNRAILEVGCSTGSNLRLLQRYGAVEGLEMHANAVAICNHRYPDVPVRHGAIPAPLSRRFDVICLFDVLEHIDDETRALEWIQGNLSEDGWLLITVPAFEFLWSRHDEVAHHKRRYTRAKLVSTVGRLFTIEYVTYFNFHLFPVIAAIRLLQRSLHLRGGEAEKRIGGGAFNPLLTAVFASERMWLRFARLPFGVSLFLAARRRSPAKSATDCG